jgi:hypothetical protein
VLGSARTGAWVDVPVAAAAETVAP